MSGEPSATTSTRASRRIEYVEQLKDAVERCLGRGESFSELSVERLAAEAGMSRSSFYRYFEDKDELLVAIAQELVEERNTSGRAIWDVPPDSPRAAVRDAFAAYLHVCWRHRAVMRAIAEAQSYSVAARELNHAVMRAAVQRVAEHIAEGQAGGWVNPGLDPVAIAEWFVAMNDRGIALLVGRAESEERIEALADSLSTIVWLTLYDGVR